MPVRYYIVTATYLRTYADGTTSIEPVISKYEGASTLRYWSAMGYSGKTWLLVFAQGPDLSAIDADPDCIDLFEKYADAVATGDDAKALLKQRTFGDLPVAFRNRAKQRLTDRGIDVSDIAKTTPLWQAIMRLLRAHDVNCDTEAFGRG